MFYAMIVIVLATPLALHKMPGFQNPTLLDDFKFSADAAPYSHHANFDKASMGLVLLVFFCGRSARAYEWRVMLRQTAPIALATCMAVIGVGLWLGYSRVDLKLPAYTPIFLVTNLFFTCVAEEALFRGFLQRRFGQYLEAKGFAHGALAALASVALLFGLVHTGGGWGYVMLAIFAGLGYGYAYQRSGHIETSILVHFTVNTVHFLGFTYPRLA